MLHWFVIEINHKYPTNDLVFNALIEWLILYYMNIYFSFTSQWLTLKQINPLDCHFHIVQSFTIFQYNLINRLGWNSLTLLFRYKVHEMPFNSHENHFLYINSKKKNPQFLTSNACAHSLVLCTSHMAYNIKYAMTDCFINLLSEKKPSIFWIM